MNKNVLFAQTNPASVSDMSTRRWKSRVANKRLCEMIDDTTVFLQEALNTAHDNHEKIQVLQFQCLIHRVQKFALRVKRCLEDENIEDINVHEDPTYEEPDLRNYTEVRLG